MYKEYLIWLLGCVLVVLIAYGYAQQRNIKGRYQEFQTNELEIDKMKVEIQALQDKVEKTKNKVKSLGTDPTEIEAIIRQERKLTRDGEHIYHIEDAPESNSSDAQKDVKTPDAPINAPPAS